MKIGELAERVGATPRTIRYYEEIGLLGGDQERPAGGHRVYDDADVERLELILRLKDLLGVSLDDLKMLIEAEDARAALRREWRGGTPDEDRRHEILEESLTLIDRQLELVRARRAELDALEADLLEKRKRNRSLVR